MKQKLLTDIELDVHELKYLMDSFTKEPTPTLSELLKRSITRMQGRLDELQQEVDAVQVISPSAVEETAEEEDEVAGSEEDSPVIIQSLESVVVKEDEEGEAIVAEEKPVVIAAAAETAAEEAAAQYIVVRLGEEQYGIDIRYVDNIVRMQHITRVPKVASYIRGVINLRGEVIPVMSIRLKMGLPEDVEVKSTRIIILKHEQHGTIGIIVDLSLIHI